MLAINYSHYGNEEEIVDNPGSIHSRWYYNAPLLGQLEEEMHRIVNRDEFAMPGYYGVPMTPRSISCSYAFSIGFVPFAEEYVDDFMTYEVIAVPTYEPLNKEGVVEWYFRTGYLNYLRAYTSHIQALASAWTVYEALNKRGDGVANFSLPTLTRVRDFLVEGFRDGMYAKVDIYPHKVLRAWAPGRCPTCSIGQYCGLMCRNNPDTAWITRDVLVDGYRPLRYDSCVFNMVLHWDRNTVKWIPAWNRDNQKKSVKEAGPVTCFHGCSPSHEPVYLSFTNKKLSKRVRDQE